MATSSPATESRSRAENRQSLFFRDLASPLPSSTAHRRQRLADAAAAATPSPLPPPPLLTLSDRPEYTADPFFPSTPSPSPTPPGPPRGSRLFASPSPLRGGGGSAEENGWSPHLARNGGAGVEDKGKGVLEPDGKGKEEPLALITLPPPREVARPEAHRGIASFAPVADLDGEEWVTVYGFLQNDTNVVLREFENCGVIVRHVVGPRDANWMHILYQSRYDARKALAKHGQNINSILIIGVRPMDPRQCAFLDENPADIYHGSVDAPLRLPTAGNTSLATRITFAPAPGINITQNGSNTGRQAPGAIASPSKSVVSRVMDLMFGL